MVIIIKQIDGAFAYLKNDLFDYLIDLSMELTSL